ncbi:hypothetical protein CRL705_987 [Latilactobacillus curvatus CRL 705]|nr:hypothetical protein CRL705_987 [Latilactobacillus curvatus CRL 705]
MSISTGKRISDEVDDLIHGAKRRSLRIKSTLKKMSASKVVIL